MNKKIYLFACIESYLSICFSSSKWSWIKASKLPDVTAIDIHIKNEEIINRYIWSAHR